MMEQRLQTISLGVAMERAWSWSSRRRGSGRQQRRCSWPVPWTKVQMVIQTQLSSKQCLLCIALMLQLVALSLS